MRNDSVERFILKKLLAWKNSPYRKPLILKGVRQVGKTWILKEFGRRYYENTAYFNFDENEEYKQFFETTKDVDRILQNLMHQTGIYQPLQGILVLTGSCSFLDHFIDELLVLFCQLRRNGFPDH